MDIVISLKTKTQFTVGPWQVSPQLGQLERDGAVQHLEPKVMQVLVALAERPGEVVSKQQLMEQVWESRTVGDEVITRSISLLRSCFGDNPKTPKYIETLPKLGYRLIAESGETSLTSGEVSSGIDRSSIRRSKGLWLAARLVALGVLLTAGYWWSNSQSETSVSRNISSVAVLPFVNMSGPEQRYLAEGISEQIISTLGALPDVDVAARRSSFRFRDSDIDVREIAQQLGVRAIVEGSVRRSGDMLRVSAQMVDGQTGYQLWSDTIDGDIEDAFDLQERVSTALARELLNTSSTQVPSVKLAPPKSFAAYDAYLRAQYAFNRRTKEDLSQAIELYKESIALDKYYAPSYLGLAYSYLLLPSYSKEDASTYYDRALATIDQSATVNPASEPIGASVRGFILFKRGQWIASRAAFEQALSNAYVEPTTFQWYSQMLASVGQLERSLEMAQRGREADPLSPVANSRLAIAHLWLDQNDQARHFFDIANSLGLTTSVHLEAYTLLLLREQRFDEVNQLVARIQQAQGQQSAGFELAMQAITQRATRPEALVELRVAMDQQQIAPRIGVLLWALLNAPDQAAAAALKLVEQGDLFEYELLFISELEAVRAIPDFQRALDQMDLHEYWSAVGCEWSESMLRCTH